MKGWHEEYGKSHAEVNAVNSVQDPSLLTGASLYVNLEPCSFHGHTPPCADMLANLPLKEVVIAGTDPHPKVNGAGKGILIEAGINVREGILREKAEILNKRFLTFHQKKRPWILLKWAETSDGFCST